MTYRVWYKDGSARLVTAGDETEARGVAQELAILDAADIKIAWAKEKGLSDRAKELADKYIGLTKVTRVERLA